MMGTQRLPAIVMSFLLAGIPGRASPDVLGIVVLADRASVSGHLLSEGTSVYGGDRLSTETRGTMQLRSGGVTLALGEESSVIVRGDASSAGNGLVAELLSGSGTMALSSAAEGAAEIQALGARIRPGANARVIMWVRILNPKELIVFARRGSVQVSYGEESEMILEGKSYYVLLDPADSDNSKDQNTKAPRKRRKAFVLIAIAAAATGISIPLALQQHYESPDRP
jgi:hypothetical protein